MRHFNIHHKMITAAVSMHAFQFFLFESLSFVLSLNLKKSRDSVAGWVRVGNNGWVRDPPAKYWLGDVEDGQREQELVKREMEGDGDMDENRWAQLVSTSTYEVSKPIEAPKRWEYQVLSSLEVASNNNSNIETPQQWEYQLLSTTMEVGSNNIAIRHLRRLFKSGHVHEEASDDALRKLYPQTYLRILNNIRNEKRIFDKYILPTAEGSADLQRQEEDLKNLPTAEGSADC